MTAKDDAAGESVGRGPSAQEQLRRIVEHAPIVLWSTDAEGTFTVSEGYGLQALGLAPGQVVGLSAFDVYRDYPTIVDNLRRALAGEDVKWTVEVQARVFETRAWPLPGAGGAVDGMLGLAIDVTDRLRAEREYQTLQSQLLQTQKLESLGVLAGGIAHDFNNLLTAILGSTSTAILSLAPEARARRHLDNVVTAAQRAADLTRQLLAYAGKGMFDVRRFDLSAHIRELATVLETAIAKKVQLRLQLKDDLPAIEADMGQVQQVIMNLVLNGAEAMGGEVGTVMVTTGVQEIDEFYARALFAPSDVAHGRYVFFEVHDTGSGMSDDMRSKIFDPFFTTKAQGRGLGLAAVLGIINAHSGAIKVYSSPGRGSSFKVFLPAADQPAEQIVASEGTFRGEGLVLVIDDEEMVRTALRSLLEFFGFDVVEAADGAAGVEQFRAHAADCRLVVLDMTMPKLGGEETFREIRRIRDDVPVILTSGYNEVEATRHFTAKGLAGFLQKPFTPEELADRLKTVFGGDVPRA